MKKLVEFWNFVRNFLLLAADMASEGILGIFEGIKARESFVISAVFYVPVDGYTRFIFNPSAFKKRGVLTMQLAPARSKDDKILNLVRTEWS